MLFEHRCSFSDIFPTEASLFWVLFRLCRPVLHRLASPFYKLRSFSLGEKEGANQFRRHLSIGEVLDEGQGGDGDDTAM